MYIQRSTDPINSDNFHRKERLVICDTGIYYKTREQKLVGPFATESKAKLDLNIFIEVISIEKQLEADYGLQVAWG